MIRFEKGKTEKREKCTVRREEEPSSELMNVDSSSYEVAVFLNENGISVMMKWIYWVF